MARLKVVDMPEPRGTPTNITGLISDVSEWVSDKAVVGLAVIMVDDRGEVTTGHSSGGDISAAFALLGGIEALKRDILENDVD